MQFSPFVAELFGAGYSLPSRLPGSCCMANVNLACGKEPPPELIRRVFRDGWLPL